MVDLFTLTTILSVIIFTVVAPRLKILPTHWDTSREFVLKLVSVVMFYVIIIFITSMATAYILLLGIGSIVQ